MGTVLLCLFFSQVVAQQVWTFEQLSGQARVSHPLVKARQSSAQAARADLDGANWQRYPTPSVEAGYDNRADVSTGLFRLQQPLWTGGRITGGIDAARARLGAAEKSIGESQRDITLRVINAFSEAQRGQARLEVARRAVRQHEELLALIDRRVQAEASPSVDRDLAQSRLFQALNDLSSVRQTLGAAYTQLTQLAGQSVTRVQSREIPLALLPESVQAAADTAWKTSPTLARLRREEEAAKADIDVKSSAYWPQLALRYEKSSVPLSAQGFDNRLMVVLETQLGAGLSAGAGVAGAMARQQAASDAREAAARDLTEQLNLAWEEWRNARERFANAQLASGSAKEVFESYTRQYTAGRKTWLDVLNAVREASQADLAVVDVLAQMMNASLRLQLLTGQLDSTNSEK